MSFLEGTFLLGTVGHISRGGGCDCEVALNVDMTAPKPLVDFSCADCAYDYDEYYMVSDDIWKAHGAGKGMLCIAA
jgi:hypothetical protein